jgi:4Fe-4S ferredoxin
MQATKERAQDACKGVAGKVAPVIDRNRCEAKEDCVRLCPYNVFEVRPLGSDEKATMSWLGRLKAFAHGNRQAFAVRAADCHACQLCVAACPEQAISLAAYHPS